MEKRERRRETDAFRGIARQRRDQAFPTATSVRQEIDGERADSGRERRDLEIEVFEHSASPFDVGYRTRYESLRRSFRKCRLDGGEREATGADLSLEFVGHALDTVSPRRSYQDTNYCGLRAVGAPQFPFTAPSAVGHVPRGPHQRRDE